MAEERNPKVLIVFASLTGNTEELSKNLVTYLKHLKAEVKIKECTQMNAWELNDYDICIISTYTYGDGGELPDEIQTLYDELGNMDLSGKVFGVLGTGDTMYEYFCRAVDIFDEKLIQTNATPGTDPLKVNYLDEGNDPMELGKFAKELVDTYRNYEI